MKFQRFLPFPRSEGKNEKYTVILPLGARERMKILFVKGIGRSTSGALANSACSASGKVPLLTVRWRHCHS